MISQQAQVSIEEGRQLRSKLHLAEQAQSRAQQTERDYEEVVAMLENEVAQLKMQLAKSVSRSLVYITKMISFLNLNYSESVIIPHSPLLSLYRLFLPMSPFSSVSLLGGV